MKYTLLGLTQAVLSSLDSDEVNSINDTVESQQVVQIIKRCYGNIAEGADFPDLYIVCNLTASGDTDFPTVMFLPTENIKNIVWLKYDKKLDGETDTDFQIINYLDPDEFFRRMHALTPSTDSSLETANVEIDEVPLLQLIYRNDIGPSFYTKFADQVLVFDSYDSAVDTTLQSSKTLAYGEAALPWEESDTFDIPIGDHQLLLNEAIALAWAEMKQAVNSKAEREARNQKVTLQRKKHAINPDLNFKLMTPNYGRK